MGAWTVGHNRPGYLPESDVSALAEWSDADTLLRSEMAEWADTDDETAREVLEQTAVRADYPDFENTGYGDDEPSASALVDAILTDDGPVDGKDFTATVNDNNGHAMGFWIQWSDDVEPDQD